MIEAFRERPKIQDGGSPTNCSKGRYVLRLPLGRPKKCEAAAEYKPWSTSRRETKIKTLANLTSWDEKGIREK